MARPNSRTGADPDAVMARLRERFNLGPPADPDPVALSIDDELPLDLMADPAATRAAIARIRGTA